MKGSTSLCLLVMNELTGCQKDIPQIDRSQFDEVFAIDANSIDETAEFLRQSGVKVHRQTVRGLNAAYWQAVELCQSDNLVVFFPKGTINPAIVYEIKRQLETHDVVVASRIGPGASNEEDAQILRIRKWGVQALAAFTSLVWRREGIKMRDVLHGVKGFSISAFRDMKISRRGLSIDLEMNIRAYRLRLSRCELPVHEGPRLGGQTHFKVLPTARRLGAFLIREILRPVPLSQTTPVPVDKQPAEPPT